MAIVSGEGVSDLLTRTVGGLSMLGISCSKWSPYIHVLAPNTPHCFESVLVYRSLLGVQPKMTLQKTGNVPLDQIGPVDFVFSI